MQMLCIYSQIMHYLLTQNGLLDFLHVVEFFHYEYFVVEFFWVIFSDDFVGYGKNFGDYCEILLVMDQKGPFW